MTSSPAWPQGRSFQAFYAEVRRRRDTILKGRMVCFDPSSGSTSPVGWAVFLRGTYANSGTIAVKRSAAIGPRLAEMVQKVAAAGLDTGDVFVVELLRGRMVHPRLHWAVGALVAGLKCEDPPIEIPIPVWKAMARITPGYVKSDELDARAFGDAIIRLARGVEPTGSVTRAPRRKRRSRVRAGGSGRVRHTKRARGGKR